MGLTNFPFGVSSFGVPLIGSGNYTTTGNVFFVDSGATNASDNTSSGNKEVPFLTIEYAFGRCTSSNGDIIFVMPGHTEDIDGAAAINADVAGVRVVGLGEGRNRPTLTASNTASTVTVTAANITWENFYIDTSAVVVVNLFVVSAADFTMRNCDILMADSTEQAAGFLLTTADADRLKFLHNYVDSTNAGAVDCINIIGTNEGMEIGYNYIHGDFSGAPIQNPTANVALNVWIHDNYIQNDNAGEHAIELVSAVTGVIERNHLVTDVYALAMDPGSCKMFNNSWCDSAVDTGHVSWPQPGVDSAGAGDQPQVAHTGEVFFVDSGHADAADTVGYGLSPSSPFLTIDFANDQCTASNGDTIYVMAGHTDSVANATDLNLDKIGVHVIGLGEGDNRPLINLITADTADCAISAASVRVSNMRIACVTFDSMTAMMTISAAGVEVDHCDIEMADSGQQADKCITTNSARTYIHNNIFRGSADDGLSSAVEITSTPDGVRIIDNNIVGQFSGGGIQCASVATNVEVRDNFVNNTATGVAAIVFSTTATGIIKDNMMVTDAVGTSFDPGSCMVEGNKYSDSGFLDGGAMDIPYGMAAANVAGFVPTNDKFLSHTAVTTAMSTGWDNPSTNTIFTVTGDVIVWAAWMVVGGTAITSSGNTGTLELGVTNNIAVLQASTTVGSGVFAAQDVWSNGAATPGQDLETSGAGTIVSGDGTNIIATVGTADLSAGVCDFYCIWSPLTPSATVVGTTI